MSTKTFKSASSGRVLEVERGAATVDLFIGKAGSFKCFEVNLADAPALALAILEAAGVKTKSFNESDAVEMALAHLSEHVGIEAAKAKEAADREVLEKRRDELAGELAGSGLWYSSRSVALQRAIDRIIELEDKAKS